MIIITKIKENIKVISVIFTIIGSIAGGIKAYRDIFSHMETQGHSAKVEQKINKLGNKIETLDNKIDALNNKFDKACPGK